MHGTVARFALMTSNASMSSGFSWSDDMIYVWINS